MAVCRMYNADADEEVGSLCLTNHIPLHVRQYISPIVIVTRMTPLYKVYNVWEQEASIFNWLLIQFFWHIHYIYFGRNRYSLTCDYAA